MPKSRTHAYPFDSIVVFTNPASKQADLANKRIARLEKLFPDAAMTVLDAKDTVAASKRILLSTLEKQLRAGKRPVLGIAGGDGTVNTLLQLLADSTTPEQLRQIPIVPMGTGNANDLAYMLYGNPLHPELAFEHGLAIGIRPLTCVIKKPDGTTDTWIASNYISFGAIAHGAHELNKPEVRDLAHQHTWYGNFMNDFRAVRAALRAPTFRVRVHGQPRTMRDIVIGNGERVAKLGRMPARIDRADLYILTIEHGRLGRGAVPLEAIKLMLGRSLGQLLSNKAYSFTTKQEVRAQYDGEPALVPAGSTVTISHAPLAVQALSTRLG